MRVECYAGYRGEQEPIAFWIGERRVAVRALVDQWLAPMQRCFKVHADDGNMYVLRQHEPSGEWEIAEVSPPARSPSARRGEPRGRAPTKH